MACVYQCINGKGVLLSGDCPIVPCDQDGGECFLPDAVYVRPCPDPWPVTAPEVKTDEVTP